MNRSLFVSLALCLVVCGSAWAQKGKVAKKKSAKPESAVVAAKPQLMLKNPDASPRTDEPIVLTRKQIEDYLGKLPEGQVIIVRSQGQVVASQMDDFNLDGIYDELAFVINLAASELKPIQLAYVEKSKAPRYPQRCHARLGLSENRNDVYVGVKQEIKPDWWKPQMQPQRYLLEGPGWENDKVGFRHYFDSRQAKDIFGKILPGLVIDSIGIPKTRLADYHTLKPWGMDVLKVGTSLGAGGFAVVQGKKLYPLGEPSRLIYQLIADGPVRSIIRLYNSRFKVDAKEMSAEETIILWAGKYWYENRVSLPESVQPETLAVGVVNLKNPGKPVYQGPLNERFESIISHAKQSENADLLGMALILPKASFGSYGEAPKEGAGVTSTWYGTHTVNFGETLTYYFVSGWEKSAPEFTTPEGFKAHVQAEANKLASPAEVVWGKK